MVAKTRLEEIIISTSALILGIIVSMGILISEQTLLFIRVHSVVAVLTWPFILAVICAMWSMYKRGVSYLRLAAALFYVFGLINFYLMGLYGMYQVLLYRKELKLFWYQVFFVIVSIIFIIGLSYIITSPKSSPEK